MRLIVGILLLYTIFVSSNVVNANTVTASIGDYPPYTSGVDTDARLLEEIVEKAYNAAGYQLIIRRVPWKRAMLETQAGQSDITFGWFKTDDREEKFYYSLPIYPVEELFFYNKSGDFFWTNLDDLKNFRIGGTLGYSHVETLKKAGISVETTSSDEKALMKIYYDRIDATPIERLVGFYILSKMPKDISSQISYSPQPLTKNALFAIAGKNQGHKSKLLIEKLNHGLKLIRSNGEMERILSNYQLEADSHTTSGE